MGKWEFNVADPSNVYVNPNQGDQFDNDDVDLAEALVRETIQNSSDASVDGNPVKVRFNLITIDGASAVKMRERLQPLQPHLVASKLRHSGLSDTKPITMLVIEDFNTCGLTGRFDIRDDGHFTSFWRNLARSEKSGQAGGRWGLGKLVFSAASNIRSFFGLTYTADDEVASIMGQSVLVHHEIGDKSYMPHGFWFDGWSERGKLQLPVTDVDKVREFIEISGAARKLETGLTIVIPFLKEEIDEESIIASVVDNYYFPILSGLLEVEVGDTLITVDTFLEVAVEKTKKQIPFAFVKEISDAAKLDPAFVAIKSVGKTELEESYFDPQDIEEMKTLFARGELVSIRVPVVLRPKDSTDKKSYIDLYLKALPEEAQPFALFSRGPIILSAERGQFSGASALGALVANDKDVARFLGDAENPAHTRWNPKAEKLKSNWRMPNETLTTIRHSLKKIYNLVADQQEIEDPDALLDFFSIKEPDRPKPNQGKVSPKPKPVVEPRETAISIQPRRGGFEIKSGSGAKNWKFPRQIRVRVAYDMIGADPFKRHSAFDFNLQKNGEIQIDPQGSPVKAIKSNILVMTVNTHEFGLEATGFDPNRDLVVEARVVEQKS